MRKVILYSASSADGYIAGENDDLSWLFTEGDYGYSEFYESIDTTLIGGNTYRIILGFGDFPYKEKENYVFSKAFAGKKDKYVEFIPEDIPEFVRGLKKKDGRDIWLVGGGQINTLLLEHGLIDEIILSVHPAILGGGKLLFPGYNNTSDMKLISSIDYGSGLVQLHYKIIKNPNK